MKKIISLSLCPIVLGLILITTFLFFRKDDFYTKLLRGKDISILVAGDSIGYGSGASKQENNFVNLLKSYLQKKYDVDVKIINTSMSGNGTYAEYVRVSQLDKEYFDLVILCCGQNDNIKSIGKYYELLIRTVKLKWPSAEIISILQSSQKRYTELIQTIQNLDKNYDVLIADTIEPFISGKNGSYSSLSFDGIHPNDKGYAVYSHVLKNIIEDQVEKHKKTNKKIKLPEPVNPITLEYYTFLNISTNMLERHNNTFSYKLDLPKNAHIGVDLDMVMGSNYFELIVDDHLAIKKDFYREWKTQRQIIDLTEYYNLRYNGNLELKLNFRYSEQANSLKGIFVSFPLESK